MSPGSPAVPALSMLWERVDAGDALASRFGFADASAAAQHLRDGLVRHWGLLLTCERIVLSGQNLLAWMGAPGTHLVVKACADQGRFARLGVIAEAVAGLGDQGLPVAPPRRTPDGAARVVLDDGPLPLSVLALPRVDGEPVDAHDPVAVADAGAVLARAHVALARQERTTAELPGPADGDERRLVLPGGPADSSRVPHAVRRLEALVAELPDLDVPPAPVHGDVRGANVLVDRRRVTTLLDWDEMRVGHRVHDLAAAAVKLSTRFHTWDPPPPGAREHLVAGYRAVAPLTAVEERWLEAAVLAEGLGQIPRGADPAGWARAVDRGL